MSRIAPIPGWRNWDVYPDGRFVFLRAVDPESRGGFVYIKNWTAKVASLFDDP